MKKSAFILLFAIVLASCTSKPEQKPTVVYTEDGTPEVIKKDTSVIVMADMPVHIDSTEFLVHPVGELQLYQSKGKFWSSASSYDGRSSYENTNFAISSYTNYNFTGNLRNLQFEQLGTDKLVPLTDKNIRISSAQFLSDLYKREGKQLFFYTITDADTNKDGALDYKDIETLYMSKIDGSNFVKLTPNNQELIDWKIIDSINRIYFKTLEDVNKDGNFDRKDKVHYHYVNLLDKVLKPIEYYPI